MGKKKNKEPIDEPTVYIGYAEHCDYNGIISHRAFYNKNEFIIGYSEDHSKLGEMIGIPISTNFNIR
jgi:hypothetical protein